MIILSKKLFIDCIIGGFYNICTADWEVVVDFGETFANWVSIIEEKTDVIGKPSEEI